MRKLTVILAVGIAFAGFGTANAAATPKVSNTITCHEVTWTYSGFPEGVEVRGVERVKVDKVLIAKKEYKFIGPTGFDSLKINVEAGTHLVSGHVEYYYEGIHKEADHGATLTCAAEPSFTIEKLQKLAGGGSYTTNEITAKPGQTVDYEIIVNNTGNTKLTLGNFTDENCEAITGGPSEPLASGKSTTYFCHHVLAEPGCNANSATVTGTPPEGQGEPVTNTSNTVIACVPGQPAFTISKKQEIAGSGTGYTTEVYKGAVGQTVNYQITVKNTGDTRLKFTNFTDEKCDEGTISGGPGEASVFPGESTVYLCTHKITEADKAATVIENNATDTGTQPEGQGGPVTHTSNTVYVVFPNPKVKMEFTCKSVTFKFTGFPNVPNNKVVERIKLDGVVIFKETLFFNGATFENTVNVTVPPGTHRLSGHAEFKHMNGISGESDHGVDITCSAEPEFTMQKSQKIDGSSEPFTTSPIVGHVGEQIDYQIVVTNTGNVSLKYSNFEDEKCDIGTIAGGPGESQVPPKGTTTYTCDHVLTFLDFVAGTYTNSAKVTGTPPEGQGGPVTHTSNTVEAEVQE
jgi:hypothetical protein